MRRVVAAVGGRVLGTGNLGTVATSSLARSEQALTAAARAEQAARSVQATREVTQAAAERTAHALDGAGVAHGIDGEAKAVVDERHQAAAGSGSVPAQPIP